MDMNRTDANGPYTGWTVEQLQQALSINRINLQGHRDLRTQIKAELKVAKEREANNPKPIPENPGWSNFAFNARLTSGDRVHPFVCSQYDGKIAVVAGDNYWYFNCWDEFIEWLRDTEQVEKVSYIWKLIAAAPSVDAR